MDRPTALIIGGSGQDGAYLSQLLLGKSYAVHITSRRSGEVALVNANGLGVGESIAVHTVDPLNLASLESLMSEVAPTEVYHLGGETSVRRSFDDPGQAFDSIVGSMLNVLDVCRRVLPETRVFNPASSEMFGAHGKAADINTPLRPISPYGAAKAAAFHLVEAYRQSYGLFAASGVLFNHESPLRAQHFATRKIVSHAFDIAEGTRDKLHLGNLLGERDWGWAPDFVEAMWMMLQQDTPRDFVIATGKTYSLEAFTAAVFERLELIWRDFVEYDETLLRPVDIECSQSNPSETHAVLGWRSSCDFDTLVTRLVDAERAARTR